MKKEYDNSIVPVSFEVGDCVYLYVPQLSSKSNCRKLARLWTGPFVIVEKVGQVNVKIKNLQNNRTLPNLVHVNRLKRAYDRYIRPGDTVRPDDLAVDSIPENVTEEDLSPDDLQDPLPMFVTSSDNESETKNTIDLDIDGENDTTKTSYEIEKILRARRRKGKIEYFIKWKNFNSKFNSWEPEENLNDAAKEWLDKNHLIIENSYKK